MATVVTWCPPFTTCVVAAQASTGSTRALRPTMARARPRRTPRMRLRQQAGGPWDRKAGEMGRWRPRSRGASTGAVRMVGACRSRRVVPLGMVIVVRMTVSIVIVVVYGVSGGQGGQGDLVQGGI